MKRVVRKNEGPSAAAIGLILLIAGLTGVTYAAEDQPIPDYAVQVSARVQADPAQITLVWPAVASAQSYVVSRKTKDSSTWGDTVVLPGTAQEYVDINITLGTTYEYHLARVAANFTSHSYVYAGIEAPMIEDRGKVVLIVERDLAVPLAPEIARLEQDLVGDGWKVLRHDVARMAVDPANRDTGIGAARSNEVALVKGVIRADYLADRAGVRAVFLLGHVPVPYSGLIAPDAHLDHRGAWPADVYYGDMEGTWSDSVVEVSTAADPRNWNEPGDGKFDQSNTPARIAFEIGRVDFSNLPVLGQSETEMVRQYLNKDHEFRHGRMEVKPLGLMTDNFGVLDAEVPAVNGWANLASLLGSDHVASGRWLTELTRDTYLWAYGCGNGSFSRALGVIETAHFLVFEPKVVFAMLFGSYFGDWDSLNNVLRAPLAATPYTLTAAWTGRPYWYFHHMALGENIGFSARLSANNTGLYEPCIIKTGGIRIGGGESLTNAFRGVHVALMGDPTLRMHPVSPPLDLAALTNAVQGVDLNWTEPTNSALGYHVYRAPTAGGPYARLTSSMVTTTSYYDPADSSERYYMVRAVRLENSSSGTYYNPSQGVFAEAALSAPGGETNTWAGRGSESWTIRDAEGTAGETAGWDRIMIEGGLNISASSTNQFTVRIVSANRDAAPGPPENFDKDRSYSWPILTATAPITGFDAARIKLLTSGFQADLGGGVFTLALREEDTSIHLEFTANHAPLAGPALFFRAWDIPLQIDIKQFLEAFTGDPDGDGRALIQVGSSTNGTSIQTDGTSLTFSGTNNLAETISYWVQDLREYRPGDTVRTATSAITVQPIPRSAQFTAFHAIEIHWQSATNQLYQVQYRFEAGAPWTNEGPPIVGTGERMSLFQRASDVTRLYRVIEVP